MGAGRDANNNLMPTLRLGASRNLAVSTTSGQDTTINNPNTTHLRLCANIPIRFLISSGPTALATSIRLPADTVEYVPIAQGTRLAAIRDAAATADGVLNIVECG